MPRLAAAANFMLARRGAIWTTKAAKCHFGRKRSNLVQQAPKATSIFVEKGQNVKQALYIYAPVGHFALKCAETASTFDGNGHCGLPMPSIIRREPVSLPLTTDEWTQNAVDIRKLPQLYLQLSKARLSALVVTTAMGGYALCPAPLSLTTLAACGVGTCLMSFSANAFNQFLEAPFDSQMKRTQNRVLAKRLLSPTHAFVFALSSGLVGFEILYLGANLLTASLGLANIILYACVYTPMKRFSIYNTWVGSVVGGIPPLMGWAACCGSLDASALVLAGVLFAWQFPHFNSLSWNLRSDYSKAGYRMMSVTRPELLRRTALTYSTMLLGLSSIAAPLTGITTWTFAATSLPLNLLFIFYSYRFYKESDSRNAKTLFRCSLIYLPIIMTLMMISKKGPD